MSKNDTLLDMCVREALRLGYGCHVQHFTAFAVAKYGSISKYFEVNPAPPKKNYVPPRYEGEDLVEAVPVRRRRSR